MLTRLLTHPLLVHLTEDLAEEPGLAEFATEVQVRGDVQRRCHSERLEDRLNPVLASLMGALEGHLLTGDPHLAFVGQVCSGEAFDQCGLTGAVVADDGEHFTGEEVEVGMVEADDASEPLDEVASFDDGLTHAFTFLIHWSTPTARMTRRPMAVVR